jgi:tetratricopeptide (TPR) repeat protein
MPEFRQATRLKPDLAAAHLKLGSLLYDAKHNYGTAASEYREARWLKPDYARAHYLSGFCHWQVNNLNAAPEESRAAYLLGPQNQDYRREYEKMLKRVK